MLLQKLFNDCAYNIDIKGIKTSSKDIEPGDLFVCTKGANVDRHNYIEDAIQRGASAIVVSKDVNYSIPTIKVDNTNQILPILLEKYYDYPQNKLTIIGITGTDGKTTSTKIIQELLGDDVCGYIGTIGIDCKYFKDKTNNTTPPPEKLFESLYRFVQAGIKYVAIEASSEAFFYHRLDHITFDIGCITNITSEHLNTHKTLENYIACKKELFVNSKKQILNSNDLHFDELKEVSNNYITYGTSESDDLKVIDYKLYPNKTDIRIKYQNEYYDITSSLLGKFNVENLALSLLVTLSLGINIYDIIPKCSKLVIPGRMQAVNKGQNFYCLVDYAHTTNSIKNVLEFANTLDVNRIITITGQAGGRDPYKRKDIGKTILDLSTYAYLTEDDPRYEKVEDIIQMMLKDTDKTNYEIHLKRNDAIRKAIQDAKENDLLLFLGKGVDQYMAREDRRDYYDEFEEIQKAINELSHSN